MIAKKRFGRTDHFHYVCNAIESDDLSNVFRQWQVELNVSAFILAPNNYRHTSGQALG